MTEALPPEVSTDFVKQAMDDNYGKIGPRNIGGRRLAYDMLTEQTSRPFDINSEVISAVGYAGVSATDLIVDVGSGYPSLLEDFAACGYRSLVAIEPNVAQYDGLAYYELRDPTSDPTLRPFDTTMDYTLVFAPPPRRIHDDVLPLRGAFESIPLPDNCVKSLLAVQSFQSVKPEQQSVALDQIQRVLQPEGVFVDVTTGYANKQGIRMRERLLAHILSDIVGLEFIEPLPINYWHTSEDAAAMLCASFETVYCHHRSDDLIVRNDRDLELYKNIFRSSQNLYRTADSREVTTAEFEQALEVAIDTEYAATSFVGRAISDTLQRSIFVASNGPLYFDQLRETQRKYTKIRALSDFEALRARA